MQHYAANAARVVVHSGTTWETMACTQGSTSTDDEANDDHASVTLALHQLDGAALVPLLL